MPDELLSRFRSRQPLLKELAESLTKDLVDALREVPHIDRVAFRVKDETSFLKKAVQPKYSNPLEELEDQIAGRVITFFRDDIDIVASCLNEAFTAVEAVEKQPLETNAFGYESTHFIFVIPSHHRPPAWRDEENMPTTFEMQVRTLFMHAWAEPQHDLLYKAVGATTPETERQLAWLAASAWGADQIMNQLARDLKDVG